MDTNTLPPWLQSSVDPTKLSLTIESFGKLLIGLVGVVAASRGLDAQASADQAQLFIDQGVTIAASGFTLYQALMTVYGLARKLFMRAVVSSSGSASLAPVAAIAAPAFVSATPAASVPVFMPPSEVASVSDSIATTQDWGSGQAVG